jgi:hypothetical protein
VGRANCRSLVLGEPVLLLSDSTEGHFRRTIYGPGDSIADAKAQTILLNLMVAQTDLISVLHSE